MPVLKLFISHTHTHLYMFIEGKLNFPFKFKFIGFHQESFLSVLSVYKDVTSECNRIKRNLFELFTSLYRQKLCSCLLSRLI